MWMLMWYNNAYNTLYRPPPFELDTFKILVVSLILEKMSQSLKYRLDKFSGREKVGDPVPVY